MRSKWRSNCSRNTEHLLILQSEYFLDSRVVDVLKIPPLYPEVFRNRLRESLFGQRESMRWDAVLSHRFMGQRFPEMTVAVAAVVFSVRIGADLFDIRPRP